MFGIKIISEKHYRSELKVANEIMEFNERLVKKNARLENDIKDLREQNITLRSINAKRQEENESLIDKNRRLKSSKKNNPKFEDLFILCTPERCDTCTHEQKDCKKFYLERKTDTVCVCPKPSFRPKK